MTDEHNGLAETHLVSNLGKLLEQHGGHNYLDFYNMKPNNGSRLVEKEVGDSP